MDYTTLVIALEIIASVYGTHFPDSIHTEKIQAAIVYFEENETKIVPPRVIEKVCTKPDEYWAYNATVLLYYLHIETPPEHREALFRLYMFTYYHAGLTDDKRMFQIPNHDRRAVIDFYNSGV